MSDVPEPYRVAIGLSPGEAAHSQRAASSGCVLHDHILLERLTKGARENTSDANRRAAGGGRNDHGDGARGVADLRRCREAGDQDCQATKDCKPLM